MSAKAMKALREKVLHLVLIEKQHALFKLPPELFNGWGEDVLAPAVPVELSAEFVNTPAEVIGKAQVLLLCQPFGGNPAYGAPLLKILQEGPLRRRTTGIGPAPCLHGPEVPCPKDTSREIPTAARLRPAFK